METTIKNENIQGFCNQLTRLMQEPLTIGVKNRVAKILRALEPDRTAFNDSHKELLTKFGAVTTENGDLTIKGDVPQEFMDQFKELKNQPNTVMIDPIDFKRIEDLATLMPYDFTDTPGFFENYS